MQHTFLDPYHSTFHFGQIEAQVEFSGDVHETRGADVQRWRFTLDGQDLTPSFDALDAAMTDAGLADVFRALHCPRADRARHLARVPATLTVCDTLGH